MLKPKSLQVRRRVRLWCVRHRSFVTVVGGVIMLATFFVKDVLRDQEKDLADAINSAERMYLMRSDNLELRKEINEVDMNVSISRQEILQSLPRGSKVKEVPYLMTGYDGHEDRLGRLLSDTDVEVDNLQRLVAIAPPTSEHLKEFGKLYWEWDKLRLSIITRPVTPIGKTTRDDLKAMFDRDRKDYSAVWLINSRINMVGASILDDAHYTKEKRENRVKLFSPISIVLFCLGVFLTIMSRLFGIEEEGAAG